jgi:hypothetical protein
MPDGAEGPSAAHLLACFFSNPMQLNACNDTGGGGGASARGLRPVSPTIAHCRRGSKNQPNEPVL